MLDVAINLNPTVYSILEIGYPIFVILVFIWIVINIPDK